MKVQISLDDELVSRIDTYADHNYMSRSGLISLACTQFLNQNEVIMSLTNISLAIKKIADTGSIDTETLKQLDDFERLCTLMVSGK